MATDESRDFAGFPDLYPLAAVVVVATHRIVYCNCDVWSIDLSTMGFYERHILPHAINLSMRNRELRPYRERIVSAAEGRVLEVGIGSGLNLPFYGKRVSEIVGLEPAARLLTMAKRAALRSGRRVTFTGESAEAIPLENDSVDTVVMTWTLCSIPDAEEALREIRRVLRSGGQLLFVEHGLAPEENVRKWQDRLTPVWKTIGGGCHLNRPIRGLLEGAGFELARLDTGYMKGPKPMAFMYEGAATRAPRAS